MTRPMAWTKYRRTQIAEMIDWTPGFDMTAVSVSDADQKNGSPKAGDKIAYNPANHDDRWLIAADYFAANFEPVNAAEEKRHVTGTFRDARGAVPQRRATDEKPEAVIRRMRNGAPRDDDGRSPVAETAHIGIGKSQLVIGGQLYEETWRYGDRIHFTRKGPLRDYDTAPRSSLSVQPEVERLMSVAQVVVNAASLGPMNAKPFGFAHVPKHWVEELQAALLDARKKADGR